MENNPEEMFLAKLEKAPPEARDVLNEIRMHFEKTDYAEVLFTRTERGDMRLAIPAGALDQKKNRIFATLRWRHRDQVVILNIYLKPYEFRKFGFDIGNNTQGSETQIKEVHLTGTYWRHGSSKLIEAFEAAHLKLYNDLTSN